MQGSELRVCTQHVVFMLAVLLCFRVCILPEPCCDLIKRPALSLRHLEVGEDEEDEQQHGEDDEDVRACQLLNKRLLEIVSFESADIYSTVHKRSCVH